MKIIIHILTLFSLFYFEQLVQAQENERLAYADAYFLIGNNKLSLQEYLSASNISSQNHKALFAIGELFNEASDWKSAKVYYTSAYCAAPNNDIYIQSIHDMNINLFAACEISLSQVALDVGRFSKNEPDLLSMVLDECKKKRQSQFLLESEILILSKLIERHPKSKTDYLVYKKLGALQYKISKNKQAIENYEFYVKHVPDDSLAQMELGEIYERILMDEKAINIYENLLKVKIKHDLQSIKLVKILANYYLKNLMFDKALKYLELESILNEQFYNDRTPSPYKIIALICLNRFKEAEQETLKRKKLMVPATFEQSIKECNLHVAAYKVLENRKKAKNISLTR